MKNQRYIELKELIDVNVLQYIQDQLVILTGVAFITVDYRGIPLTKESGFCNFCKSIRRNKDNVSICYKSDAHGGLESAIRKKPYIYICPAGLADFSVPIIVNGQYLGAMLSGQVRTDFSRIKNRSSSGDVNNSWKEDRELVREFNETTYIEYEKLVAIAELTYTMINVIAEKSMIGFMQNELQENAARLEEEIKARQLLEEKIELLEKEKSEGKVNLQYIFNVVNSIGRLSYLENAKESEELAYLLAEIIRYVDFDYKDITLKEEFHYIKKYLAIQSIRFNRSIKYHLELADEVREIKIPYNLCIPLIENALIHGIDELDYKGMINIRAFEEGKYLQIIIEDNGRGMDEKELLLLSQLEVNKEKSVEGLFSGKGIKYCQEILTSYYGERASIFLKSKAMQGTKVIIKIAR